MSKLTYVDYNFVLGLALILMCIVGLIFFMIATRPADPAQIHHTNRGIHSRLE